MSTIPLTQEQLDSWNNNGILLLRNVLKPAEIRTCLESVDDFIEKYENDDQVKSTAHAHGKEFFHILNIISHSDKFDTFIDHEKVFDIISYLTGPYVQLMGLDLFIRRPNKTPNYICKFHTDGGPSLQKILPNDTNLPIQFKVQYFLTDMNQDEMSNFIYIPGSHKMKVEHNDIFCTIPSCNEYVDKGLLPENAVQLKVSAGDVLIHPWSLWHCISNNKSNVVRKSISVRYGQMWLKSSLMPSAELLNRLTPRQRRLLCDFGDATTADSYRPPMDQIELILGDKAEAFGWK